MHPKASWFGLISLVALAAAPAGAQQFQAARFGTDRHPGHLGWQMQGSIEYGGDRVAEVLYTNGQSQTLRAGQGAGIAAGGHYRFRDFPFDISATAGVKYVTTLARNADIHIDRTVFELQGTWWLNNDFWLAAGPVMHTGGGFSSGGLGPNLRFDNATGVFQRVGWRYVALGYTGIHYTDQYGDRLDASSVGVYFLGRF